MFVAPAWQFSPYALPLMISGIVSTLFVPFAWRRRPTTGAVTFIFLALSLAVWSLGNALELLSVDLDTKLFWVKIEYFGIMASPLAWLLFALQYSGRGEWITPRRLLLLALVPAITVALVWTNEAHGLVRADIRLDTSGPFAVITKRYGPWFWVAVAYNYSLMLAGSGLLVQVLRTHGSLFRGQAVALLTALVVPWLANALYISQLSPIPHLDLTPCAFTLSGLVAGWALLRLRLLDVVPVARAMVVESMGDGVVVLDAQNRVVDINPAAVRLLGCPGTRVIGRPAAEVFAARSDLVERYRDVSEAEDEIVQGTGESLRYLHLRISPLRDRRARLSGRLILLCDVTEQRAAGAALQESNRRLASWVAELEQRNREMTLLNEMGEMLQICFGAEEAYAAVGRYASQLFPTESGALYVVRDTPHLVEAVAKWGEAPPSQSVFTVGDCWALRRGQAHLAEPDHSGPVCLHPHPPEQASTLCVPLIAQGEALGVLHLAGNPAAPDMAADAPGRISAAKQRLAVTVAEHVALALSNLKLRETLRSQAIRDPLTNLFNRRYMEESLEREVRRAHRSDMPLGIVMLDLDNFKQFNDTYGHLAGDDLLRAVGHALQSHIRGEDIACRYGGEEFILVLPEASLVDTCRRAEHLRELVKHLRLEHNGETIGGITVSLGVAVYPDHGTTAEALLRAADAALYRAKAQQRDMVMIAT